MNPRIITEEYLKKFEKHLWEEEKSRITVEKYLRDVRNFFVFSEGKPVNKDMVLEYKRFLTEKAYAVRSINSMLASLNSFFVFSGWEDCKVKCLKIQHMIYCPEDKELTKAEYFRLLDASKDQPQLELILQTICGTGIRISELSCFTVEAVQHGEIHICCKNKNRRILIPGKLKKMLLRFAKKNHIMEGVLFRTRSGRPVNRSNVWKKMKKICERARVNPSKVFPHNLRKLFAKTFYGVEKDIAKLADILGHSSINTTRIYIMTSGLEHRRKIERLGLVVGYKKITT